MRKKGIFIIFAVILLYFVFRWFSPSSIYSMIILGINPKQYGSICEYGGQCGNLVAISCRPEVDGSLLYINKTTKEVAQYCGGYCMGDREQYCQECPPKEWNCK